MHENTNISIEGHVIKNRLKVWHSLVNEKLTISQIQGKICLRDYNWNLPVYWDDETKRLQGCVDLIFICGSSHSELHLEMGCQALNIALRKIALRNNSVEEDNYQPFDLLAEGYQYHTWCNYFQNHPWKSCIPLGHSGKKNEGIIYRVEMKFSRLDTTMQVAHSRQCCDIDSSVNDSHLKYMSWSGHQQSTAVRSRYDLDIMIKKAVHFTANA